MQHHARVVLVDGRATAACQKRRRAGLDARHASDLPVADHAADEGVVGVKEVLAGAERQLVDVVELERVPHVPRREGSVGSGIAQRPRLREDGR